MTLVAFSGFLTFICGYACGIIIVLFSPRTYLRIVWSMFSFSMGTWGFGLWMAFIVTDQNHALFWSRFLNISAIFIPVFFFHFILLLTDLYQSKIKELRSYYLFAIIYFLSSVFFINEFIPSVTHKLSFAFYPNAGKIYYLFPIYFSYLVVYALVLLVIKFKSERSQLKQNQFKYVLIGSVVGFSGGSTTFPLVFNLPVYPFGPIQVPIYLFIITYAIIRFRLMDIKLVLTRVGIFLFVYSLCLGIPVWVGIKLLGHGTWLMPVTLMGILATAGPFIYLYIQKRAEDKLLQEQKRYQTTLSQASAGMGRIKELKKLLNLIVYVVTRTVRLEHALVYTFNENKKEYVLGAFKRRSGNASFIKSFGKDLSLVRLIVQTKNPIVAEEVAQNLPEKFRRDQIEIEKTMADFKAAIVFPIQVESRLLALIVLGRKESGKVFTEGDLSVFSILANQAALAIENAQFYEEMKRTHEQLYQAEKMATIGTMADGLSHQINNRFHALGFIAGDALDTIKLNKDKPMPDNVKEIMSELERAFVRVQDNVVQGGEVVQGLLKYTRKGDAGMTAVDFDQAFKSALEMAQFKIKTQNLKIVKTYNENIPKIKGNFTQLQEVFFNLIDNAYDAMMQRKTEKQEPDYQPTLTISIQQKDSLVEIVFADNGIGVKVDDMSKLFTPFFTTKLSSKKGTGLGLYVIKKIIEENHQGVVQMDSAYMIGTQMKLRLPVAVQ